MKHHYNITIHCDTHHIDTGNELHGIVYRHIARRDLMTFLRYIYNTVDILFQLYRTEICLAFDNGAGATFRIDTNMYYKGNYNARKYKQLIVKYFR